MIENAPLSLKTEALSQIIKSLILNSKNAEIFRLREILVESGKPLEKRIVVLSKKQLKENLKKRIKSKFEKSAEEVFDNEIFEMEESRPIKKNSFAMVPNSRQFSDNSRSGKALVVPKRVLRIPESQLPDRLRDVRPVASEKRIDIGKLNILVQDRNVESIETAGEGEKVYVTGNMGKKPTNIILSKEEILEVINRFSQEAKIPKHEGFFKVAVGNLILTAMVSESVSSRFVIKKLRRVNSPPVPRP